MRKKFTLAIGLAVAFCGLCALSEWSQSRLDAKPIEVRKPAAEATAGPPEFGLCVGGEVFQVVDGDTLKFRVDPIELNVRLDACWAEESRGPLEKRTAKGAKATADLKTLAEGKRGRLFLPGSRRLADLLTLDRVVGRVWREGDRKDLSTIQVERGNATRTKPKAGEPGAQLDPVPWELVPDRPFLMIDPKTVADASHAKEVARGCRNPFCYCESCSCGANCSCDVAEKAPEYIRPEVCARVRVKDPEGINFGSATVVEGRDGGARLVSCEHLFRGGVAGKTIEIDLFDKDRASTIEGTLLAANESADVALLKFRDPVEVACAAIARPGRRGVKGDPVVSLGCSGGDPPSRIDASITAINRYLGPENVECSGVPIDGRSGGGLFNAAGELIGVCIAADPKEGRGVYAGLSCIHDLFRDAAKTEPGGLELLDVLNDR